MLTSPGKSLLGSYLALFTSLGTLLCCALPSALVFLGLGATVASFLSAAPWLVTLAQHRNWVFGVSGILILGNLLYVYLLAPRLKGVQIACEVTAGPSACDMATRVSRITLWLSAGIWLTGFTFAFVVVRFLAA